MRVHRWLALALLLVANLLAGAIAATIGVFATVVVKDVATGQPTSLQRLFDAGPDEGPLDIARRAISNVVDSWIDVARELYPDQPESAAALAVALVAVIAPALIAAPALRSAPPDPRGRSLKASVAGAAALGGACVIGVIATAWDALGLTATQAPIRPDQWLRGGVLVMVPWLLVPTWLVAGTVWAMLIRRAGLARKPDGLDRMVRRIFAGSCVELAIAAPTFVFAVRRDDCTCAWGSWWAMVAGITSLGLLCGPAVVLLATRKARMQWMRGACTECGYPLRGNSGTCPECGKSVPG